MVKAFLCIEGETSELRFVFFEMFALEELLLPSTPQTFLTKYRGVKESTKVITFVVYKVRITFLIFYDSAAFIMPLFTSYCLQITTT